MEKFAVVYQIGTCSPHIDETFSDENDATQYKNIMQRKHPEWKYAVYQLMGA